MEDAVTKGYCSMASSFVIKEIIRIQTDKKMASDSKYYVFAQRQWWKLDLYTSGVQKITAYGEGNRFNV